ncbi:MAG TPA: response regulator transcription factor [Chloroflexi bacterium]|nr:response regulator transcription factor [Chloroflexota bacterium]
MRTSPPPDLALPTVARKLLDRYLQQRQAPPLTSAQSYEALSEREREVMFLLLQELSNKEIAEKPVISPSTVQTHRARILQKLGLENTIELRWKRPLPSTLRRGASPATAATTRATRAPSWPAWTPSTSSRRSARARRMA